MASRAAARDVGLEAVVRERDAQFTFLVVVVKRLALDTLPSGIILHLTILIDIGTEPLLNPIPPSTPDTLNHNIKLRTVRIDKLTHPLRVQPMIYDTHLTLPSYVVKVLTVGVETKTVFEREARDAGSAIVGIGGAEGREGMAGGGF